MNEGKLTCMKHLTSGDIARHFLQPLVLASAIRFITDERISEMLEMDADLVGPARVKQSFDERGTAQPFQNSVRSQGGAPAINHRHAFAMGWVPRNGGPNVAGVPVEFAADERVVNLVDFAPGELLGQGQV